MDVILAKEAQKQYKRLPQTEKQKIKKKIAVLLENPSSGKRLEGKLAGRQVIRAWPYRIIYSVNKDKNRIEISDILHRQGVYK